MVSHIGNPAFRVIYCKQYESCPENGSEAVTTQKLAVFINLKLCRTMGTDAACSGWLNRSHGALIDRKARMGRDELSGRDGFERRADQRKMVRPVVADGNTAHGGSSSPEF